LEFNALKETKFFEKTWFLTNALALGVFFGVQRFSFGRFLDSRTDKTFLTL
jgi:hypothetical protein